MARAILVLLVFAGSLASANATLEVVVTDDLGHVVSAAIVKVVGPTTRTLVTGADGRIVFDALSAGAYRVVVTKTLYAPAWFGRVGDGRGTPIVLDASEHYRAAMVLQRSASISGTILDGDGSPVTGVWVRAFRPDQQSGYSEHGVRTDSNGRYRLFNLPPGAYAVGVQSSDTGEFEREANGRPQTVTYPPLFYPSAISRADARDVAVTAGDDITGIDMRIVPVESSRVRVIVRASDNAIIPATAWLVPRGVDTFANSRNLSSLSIKDGEGTITGITVGVYTVFVSTRPLTGRTAGAPHGPEWGRLDISSDGRAPVDAALILEPMASVSGVVQFDGPPLPQAFLFARAPVPGAPPSFETWTQSDRQGRFIFPGFPPGSYSFTADLPKGWRLASAMSGGRDVLDEPLVINDRTAIDDVVVTYTNRLTEVSGTLVDSNRKPSFAAGIVIVADDPKLWTSTCRRVRIAEPDSKGAFAIANLPAGTYRMAADADLTPADCANHSKLEVIHRRGEVFTISAGEIITREVRFSPR